VSTSPGAKFQTVLTFLGAQYVNLFVTSLQVNDNTFCAIQIFMDLIFYLKFYSKSNFRSLP
jgi:hypothetical protein